MYKHLKELLADQCVPKTSMMIQAATSAISQQMLLGLSPLLLEQMPCKC